MCVGVGDREERVFALCSAQQGHREASRHAGRKQGYQHSIQRECHQGWSATCLSGSGSALRVTVRYALCTPCRNKYFVWQIAGDAYQAVKRNAEQATSKPAVDHCAATCISKFPAAVYNSVSDYYNVLIMTIIRCYSHPQRCIDCCRTISAQGTQPTPPQHTP